jgi:hypothetical protein
MTKRRVAMLGLAGALALGVAAIYVTQVVADAHFAAPAATAVVTDRNGIGGSAILVAPRG